MDNISDRIRLLVSDDRGVSPVVGVILMVAVTVILAAVIGAFVLDLGSNVNENVNAGVSINEDSSDGTVSVQVMTIGNADHIIVRSDGTTQELSRVGETTTLTTSERVTVIGVLNGEETVLQTYEPQGGASIPFASAPEDTATIHSEMAGSGTESDPYVITNVHELQAMDEDLAGAYTLGNDIDARGTASWNDGAGFSPIGAASEFEGGFDGQGNEIRGLTINRPSSRYTGLIARTSFPTGDLTDVSLSNVNIQGGSETDSNAYAGALIGFHKGADIHNVTASGTVTGDYRAGGIAGSVTDGTYNSYADVTVYSKHEAGGLLGSADTVDNSSAAGDVTGGSEKVGGLVGNLHSGAIKNSSATGDVTATGDQVGGLVGYAYASPVSDSYATGDVNGDMYTGGLVGEGISSTIKRSYATGDVNGGTFTGALGGSVADTVENSYATGTVTGGSFSGGFVGTNKGTITTSYYAGTISDTSIEGFVGSSSTETSAYWDAELSGQSSDDSSATVGLTTAELTGDAATDNLDNFDFDAIWVAVEGGYPELR